MNLTLNISANVNFFYDTLGNIALVSSSPDSFSSTTFFTLEAGIYSITEITIYRVYMVKNGISHSLLLDEFNALVNKLGEL